MKLLSLLPDRFLPALVAAVVVATLVPAQGVMTEVFDVLTIAGVALVFFLHGTRLSAEAIYASAAGWRLHLCILASTFVVFPVVGLLAKPFLAPILPPQLIAGLLFLCILPSTIQASTVFTSIARGNVSAAVCSASLSNLAGIVITPLLAGLLLATRGGGGISLNVVMPIVLEIALPFALGQWARRWVGGWVAAHTTIVEVADRGAIVLVVYSAFSASVVQGLWQQIPPGSLVILFMVDAALLLLLLAINHLIGRYFFAREDEVALVFCGSKKSLTAGIPIANVLFASGALGSVILPAMLFQQIQLMVCAVIARRYGHVAAAGIRRPGPEG